MVRNIWTYLFPLLFFGVLFLIWKTIYFQVGQQFSDKTAIQDIKVKRGDSLAWASPDYSDDAWTKNFPTPPAIYWWRAKIDIDSSLSNRRPLGLGIRSFLGSYEIYWDGHALGSNGIVGNSALNEKPGGIDRSFLIPESWSAPGTHHLSVRTSQFYSIHYQTRPFLIISNYDALSQALIVFAAMMHILAGIFLVIAIYYVLIYFKTLRQASFLIFSGICFCLFAMVILEYLKFYYAYPYPFHFTRLKVISALALGLGCLTPAFYFFHLKIPHRATWLSLLLFTQMAIWYFISDFDLRTYYFILMGCAATVLTLLWGMKKKQNNHFLNINAVVPLIVSCFFFIKPFFYDQALFINYAIFVVINLYALSLYLGEQRRLAHFYELQTNRLQIDLLKKSIQPHFIMNTLSSLISWVEESPGVAVQFIEALAEEFEAVNQVVEQLLIPVEQEIALCRTHLKVMSFRNEIDYKLLVKGSSVGLKVPPTIFLTLIENGLTHNRISADRADFELDIKEDENRIIYKLLAPGKIVNRDMINPKGTGLKYVEARLTESYEDQWSIYADAKEEGWLTCIEISLKLD